MDRPLKPIALLEAMRWTSPLISVKEKGPLRIRASLFVGDHSDLQCRLGVKTRHNLVGSAYNA